MPNKMLIDASHPEETRVVVVRGNRIEEFDFESQDKKQLKGNIYLARVTRVEPSLQAAFVEYGGNRHGFLAFSEIHPDYYQIPVADRQALLRAEAQEAEDEDDEEGDGEERQGRDRGRRGRRRGGKGRERGENKRDTSADAAESAEAGDNAGTSESGDAGETVIAAADEGVEAPEITATESEPAAESSSDGDNVAEGESGEDGETSTGGTSIAAAVDADVISEAIATEPHEEAASGDNDRGMLEEVHSSHPDDHEIESVGAEDALEEVRNRRKPVRRQYKIQEVIKRRQILLVQVVKEERGNKGAALTTYLSLAGRYSVLMPNTARGGGISRKITNAQDRKRLKEVVADLEVPQGMGVILRTAGESRTKAEIKRDYEYLMRLWENVRSLTLQSSAPALVYEEGSLIKRSVRDLYNKDIDEILVSGDDGYREAKDFMRMLMPSHAKNVQPYRETQPIFARYAVEAQLDAMFSPQVTLKSGGYLVINQTEALVAIDVNSGRSTREHNIEDTAYQTNLEAAEEVARQLRLRDLAGLIVIDFIDMEENRNNRAVEKKLKECLKDDRARIQVGRISAFGLLEMSRQRIRTGVLESSSVPCPHCAGAGMIRSTPSVALQILRALEETLIKSASHNLTVRTRPEVALYVLNQKRAHLADLENRFAIAITISTDPNLLGTRYFEVERGEFVGNEARVVPSPFKAEAIAADVDDEALDAAAEAAALDAEAGDSETAAGDAQGERGDAEGRDGRRRRRRRRRRRGGERDSQGLQGEGSAGEDGESDDEADDDGEDAAAEAVVVEVAAEAPVSEVTEPVAAEAAAPPAEEAKPKRSRARKPKAAKETETAEAAKAPEAAEPVAAEAAPAEKPKRSRSRKKVVPITEDGAPAAAPAASETVAETPVEAAGDFTEPMAGEPAPAPEPEAPAPRAPAEEPVAVVLTEPDPTRPKRGGWWNRLAGRS